MYTTTENSPVGEQILSSLIFCIIADSGLIYLNECHWESPCFAEILYRSLIQDDHQLPVYQLKIHK